MLHNVGSFHSKAKYNTKIETRNHQFNNQTQSSFNLGKNSYNNLGDLSPAYGTNGPIFNYPSIRHVFPATKYNGKRKNRFDNHVTSRITENLDEESNVMLYLQVLLSFVQLIGVVVNGALGKLKIDFLKLINIIILLARLLKSKLISYLVYSLPGTFRGIQFR